MKREIELLRETIKKLVPLIAGRGLKVTQVGSRAYVRADVKTKRPYLVNIPSIPDNADASFVEAISGFIDHEVAHVLYTDWDQSGPEDYMTTPEEQKFFHNVQNIFEDTMIERRMAETFPGSKHNLKTLSHYFLKNVTDKALAQAKTPSEAFSYIMVPLARALSGQEVFDDWMKANGHYANEKVSILLDNLEDETLELIANARDSKTVREIAIEVHDILFHSRKKDGSQAQMPQPPAPPEDSDDQQQEQQPSDDQQQSQDKPEKEAGEGDGDGERDHSESDGEEGDESGNGDEADDSDGKSKSSGKGEEDDNDGDEPEADADGGSDGQDDDAGSDADADGDGSSGDDDGSEDDDGSDDADDDDGEDAQGSSQDGDEEDEDAEDSSDDDGDADDGDGADADGESEGDGDSDDDGDDGEGDEDDADAEHQDNQGGAQFSDDAEEDGQDGSDQEGYGGDAGKNLFDLNYEDFEGTDMSSEIANQIGELAEQALMDSEYNVFTRDYDQIKPLEVDQSALGKSWVKNMEDSVASMIGPMQKDIERMMASKSLVVRTPGYRKGKLHTPSLYRVPQGDDRVFTQRQEQKSKTTAVTMLADNSGSMHGAEMRLAMTASYALGMTLDRVGIASELIGFTTGDIPSDLYDEFHEDRRKGIEYSRVCSIVMPIYKEFKERMTPKVKQRIAYMMNAQPGMNTNVDGESLLYAAQRLAARNEERKVMIVLSDGQPVGNGTGAHLRDTVRMLEKSGIECIGIGICSNAVQRYYRKNCVLNNASELPQLVMRELKALLS